MRRFPADPAARARGLAAVRRPVFRAAERPAGFRVLPPFAFFFFVFGMRQEATFSITAQDPRSFDRGHARGVERAGGDYAEGDVC